MRAVSRFPVRKSRYKGVQSTRQSLGFQLENLLQDLGFRHHFSVSRTSGNPVILSPGDGNDNLHTVMFSASPLVTR